MLFVMQNLHFYTVYLCGNVIFHVKYFVTKLVRKFTFMY